ncbi:hypothetical protein [Aliicoccus persicus]|uniref:Uncharacterized protein n=1 Tax=Aliicoccus persicus TaxID=930138 RepID=A0A662Z1W5_9STAP|nr:hypothetical protein [Aliicoccus persicus]SEV88452.1 hypothetical protein SAMN05192557_0722 [Aliicoccus persicus]
MAREKKKGGCMGCLGGMFMTFVLLFLLVEVFTGSDDNSNDNEEVEQQAEATETNEIIVYPM